MSSNPYAHREGKEGTEPVHDGLQRLVRDPITQGSTESFQPTPSPMGKKARRRMMRKENILADKHALQWLKDKMESRVTTQLKMDFETKEKYQGRKVSEYYKSRRVQGCFIARGICSIIVPILIAWWVLPIYEKMHIETDRLNFLRNDWLQKYPLSDVKIVDAPLPSTSSVYETFGQESNVIIEIAEDLERGQSTISRGLVRREDNICTQKFGNQYEHILPARWEGMAMGCNCTGQNLSQQYYEGSCSYNLTLTGCQQMMPFYPIDIQIVAGKWICGLRYSERYNAIPRPGPQGVCPNKTRICGGSSIDTQYCIKLDEACPINDMRLVPLRLNRADTELSEFYNLDPNFDIEVRRNADQHPIVDLKLSEEPPCLDPDKISHAPDRPLIVLEFGKLAEGCPLEIDQDQRYRILSEQAISEHQLYTENKVMDVLRLYQPEDQYYRDGVDVNLYLYGSTNFIWNPLCCSPAAGVGIPSESIYSMVIAFKTIQFLLVISIAIICAHIIISGMLLNFLILMPYCKARYVKGGKSVQSIRELHGKLLSGQIPCLEFTRAFVNSLFGFFYFFMVVTILFVAKLHQNDMSQVQAMLAAMPCQASCGAQQELIADELRKVHFQLEELRRHEFLIFALIFTHYLIDYGVSLLYRETWVKIRQKLSCKQRSVHEEEQFTRQD